MKSLLIYICLLSVLFASCDKPTDDKEVPEKLSFNYYTLKIPTGDIKCGGIDTLNCDAPYGTDWSNVVAEFSLTNNGRLYIGDTEQISGITANDFTDGLTYILKDDFGNERILPTNFIYLSNTESKLLSFAIIEVTIEYPCIIDQDAKTVVMNESIPKNWDLIGTVTIEFSLSDNADFTSKGVYYENNDLYYLSSYWNDTVIKIIADDSRYSTSYDLIVKCSNCGN